MRPWVWPGGTLHVRRCTVADLAPGDIAVWFDGRVLLSHRVVAVRDGRFVTKGDTNRAVDAPADPGQLLGRVVRFSMAGVSWRLDGHVGRLVGAAMTRAPWLVPALAAVYDPLRHRVGHGLEVALTSAPVRAWRRRIAGGVPTVASVREPGTWPIRLRARRGRLEIGRLDLAADGALTGLWVRNLWRGLGLGRALVDAAVAAARAAGLARVTVAAPPEDARARALLAAAGFTPAVDGALARDIA